MLLNVRKNNSSISTRTLLKVNIRTTSSHAHCLATILHLLSIIRIFSQQAFVGRRKIENLLVFITTFFGCCQILKLFYNTLSPTVVLNGIFF